MDEYAKGKAGNALISIANARADFGQADTDFFKKTDEEKSYEKSFSIRDEIMDYVSENVGYPTERNMADFLLRHRLPEGIYKKIGHDKMILWGVKDALPEIMAKSFERNFSRYYLNNAQNIRHKGARFKKVNTVNSLCLTALLKK